MKKKREYCDDFSDAFQQFLLRNCIPVGFGEIGMEEPKYRDCEIRVKLNSNGGGYIHLLNEDSSTENFMTMDHFRSQDMITPAQREQIAELTRSRATSIVRKENKELRGKVKELEQKLANIKTQL